MVKSADIGGLVGPGKFFVGVSSRMAYALPIGHPMGKRADSHMVSSRPGSFNTVYSEFISCERKTGFLGYNPALGNALEVKANDRVLLGVLPMCSVIFGGEIYRSTGTETAFFRDATTGQDAVFTSYDALKAAADALGQSAYLAKVPKPANDLLNPGVKLPINCVAGGSGYDAFPAFDLYASRIGVPRVGTDLHSWPTIKLADAGETAAGLAHVCGLDGFMLPEVGGCQDWLLWMQVKADVPECSFMKLRWDVLTAAK